MSDFINKLERRQFHLLLIGTVVVTAALAVSVLLIPQIKIYRAASVANAGLPPAPADSARLQAMLMERDQEIAQQARRLHGDMANLPVREIEAFVIERLQRIAWNHNVGLQSVSPSTGESIESFREILFRLELNGLYDDLFHWLQELRGELGFIVIKEYRMDRVGEQLDNPMLKVQLTIASYRKETR